jgi:tRNA(His) guanylyltransferase
MAAAAAPVAPNCSASHEVDAETPEIQGLAVRMKGYESRMDLRLDERLPFLVRLDGHKFSNFTRGFRKPFDERLHRVMVKTAADLIGELACRVAYTQSDEITLVFFPQIPEAGAPDAEPTAIFAGRVQKLTSLAASLCSVRFNFHIAQEAFAPAEEKLRARVTAGCAYFDGRAFNLPSKEEVLNNLIWRSVYDCVRNSRLNLGLKHYSQSAIHGIRTSDLIVKLATEKGVIWDDMPNSYKYGTYLKKQQVAKEGTDPRTGQTTCVMRSRVVARAFRISFSDPFLQMLEAKYWEDPPVDGELVWEQPMHGLG